MGLGELLRPGVDALDVGKPQGVTAALEEGDPLPQGIQQRQAEAGLQEPQRHPREARPGADIHHALPPEVREKQQGRGVQKVESRHLLRLRDGGEVHDLVGLQQAVGKRDELGHGVLGQAQGGETLTEDGFHQFFSFSRSRISVRSFSSAEGAGGAAGSSAFFLASLSWKPLTAFSRQKMAKAMSTKSRMVAMREP